MNKAFKELLRRYQDGDPEVVNNPKVLKAMNEYAQRSGVDFNVPFSGERALKSFGYNAANTASFGLLSLFADAPTTVGSGEAFAGDVGSILGLAAPLGIAGKGISKGVQIGKSLYNARFGAKAAEAAVSAAPKASKEAIKSFLSSIEKNAVDRGLSATERSFLNKKFRPDQSINTVKKLLAKYLRKEKLTAKERALLRRLSKNIKA